jgi:hypothetical protein
MNHKKVDDWLEEADQVLSEYEAQRDQMIADVVDQPDPLKAIHEHYLATDSLYREAWEEKVHKYIGGIK